MFRRAAQLAMAGAVGFGAALAAVGAAASVTASGASFTAHEGGTRFVLELSDEPTRRLFAVDGPPRLVIDLDETVFEVAEPAPASGLVKAWRFGALNEAAGRIVFDLEAPALVAREFYLPSMAGRPARLVVDLAPAEASVFSAAVRAADPVLPEGPQRSAAAEHVIVIDPGHGGIDPGALGPDGSLEKDLALAFAKRLQADLAANPDVRVHLTRTEDEFLSLNKRIRIARAYGADLFISIHADAAPQDHVYGATVYTLSERASDARAAALAARENLSDQVSGAIEEREQEEVSGILADFLRRETKAFSFTFADRLVEALGEAVTMNSNPRRSARFRVLMAHDIPSVLIELGYLTNRRDAEALWRPEWQARASAAIARAVEAFFDGEALAAAAETAADDD